MKQTRRIRQIIQCIPNLKADYYVEVNELLAEVETVVDELWSNLHETNVVLTDIVLQNSEALTCVQILEEGTDGSESETD